MWTCKVCGQENDGKFCIKCGNKMEEPTEAVAEEVVPVNEENPTVQAPVSPAAPAPKKKSKVPMIIGIVAGAVLLLAVIITIIAVMVHKGNDSDVPEGTGVYYYVSGVEDYSILYEKSNTESTPLAYLNNGDAVEYFYDENSKFVYVLDVRSHQYGYMVADDLVTSSADVEYIEDSIADMESLGDYYVTGTKSSLAVREEPNSDSNAIVKLYNGEVVSLLETTDDKYWYIYDYGSGEAGYVLCDYLTENFADVEYGASTDDEGKSLSVIGTYYVYGTTNYLAIRSEASSSSDAEIGKTFNGNSVAVIEMTNNTFWYIYDYSSGIYGYVKCAYLTSEYPYYDYYDYYDGYDYYDDYYYDDSYYDDYSDDDYYDYYGYYYVSGTTNYLAIRSEPSSSSAVEIGKTYNGNMVMVIEKTNSTFWYIYDYYTGLYGYVKCAYLVQY